MGCIGWRGEGGSLDKADRPSVDGWTISRRWSWTEDVVGRWTFHSIFISPILTLYVISRSYAMLYFTILLLFLVFPLTGRYCSTRTGPVLLS